MPVAREASAMPPCPNAFAAGDEQPPRAFSQLAPSLLRYRMRIFAFYVGSRLTTVSLTS
jgi:hypothetical protein